MKDVENYWNRYIKMCGADCIKPWREEIWSPGFDIVLGVNLTYAKVSVEISILVNQRRDFVYDNWNGIILNPDKSKTEEWFAKGPNGKLWDRDYDYDDAKIRRRFLCRDLSVTIEDCNLMLCLRIPVIILSQRSSLEFFSGLGISKARHHFTNYEYLLEELRAKNKYSFEFYTLLKETVNGILLDIFRSALRTCNGFVA